MRATASGLCAWRPLALVVLVVALLVSVLAPFSSSNQADAAGAGYDVSNWTDPDGKSHRIRWNPCQKSVTFAVNARLAGASTSARENAIDDVKAAFRRVSDRTGIIFTFAGRTSEIPANTGQQTWAERQRAAEIVVAWVDQGRVEYRTDLLSNSGGGYASGVGGWMMRAWTDSTGGWQAAIGRGFVVLNSDHNDRYRNGYGRGMTRGALLLHEVGHAMGLGHVGTTREIMYPTMLDRPTTAYQDGDRAGLRKVGRSLGCIEGASSAWPQI